MDQFLQPKELMEELSRYAGAKHNHCHYSIDQILNLGHASIAFFQHICDLPIALITDCNVNG